MIFRSELLNLRSTKTAAVLLVASVLMSLASTVANLAAVDDASLAEESTITLAMHASTVSTLVFAMTAGIVTATSDFRNGRIDQVLLTEPNRSRFFAAKLSSGALLGGLYGIVGSIAAVAGTTGYLSSKNVSVDLLSEPVLRPLLGVLIGSALFAALGISFGTAVRNQPAALAGSLAFMLVVEPTAIVGIPDVAKWLPGASGLGLTLAPDPNLLSQLNGALTLGIWTAVAIMFGSRRLSRADI